MTGTLTLNKRSASCTSTWTGTQVVRRGAIVYSTPTEDYDNVTITVPPELLGANFTAVNFSYSTNSPSGNSSIVFNDTRTVCTNAALLQRLKNGDSNIKLLFSFRATGGSGGTGSHSSTKDWTYMSITVTYEDASGASINQGGVFTKAQAFYNDNGTWTQCQVYYNDNGTWTKVN